jgi:glycosyltransferase involved in cell wall biosynthesis
MGRAAEIMATADRHRLAGRVHHLGVVPDAAMPLLYRRATAVVFPSLYEGFGMPPAEAMACGCPVASSLATSLAEVCGDAAIELKPDDPEQMTNAIDAVVNDEQLRARLRVAGLKQARKFTWKATADAHLEVFRRAIELAA